MDTIGAPTASVAFSTLYAESDDFLSTYIENFLLNTDETCHLFINLPSGRDVPDETRTLSRRVHLFSGTIARSKVGHTLLCGHLESFAEAGRRLDGFDYFCTLASNSLFVRPFDLVATSAKLPAIVHPRTTIIDELEDRWWWSHFKKSPDTLDYVKNVWGLTHMSAKQIEGLIARKSNWLIVYENLTNIIELGGKFMPTLEVPLEEIIPSTLFDKFGTQEYLNICHNLWGRGASLPATINDILEFPGRYSSEVCMLKWFDRTRDSASTSAVSVEWIATFLKSLPQPDTLTAGERLKHRVILQGAADFYKQRERFEALTGLWEPVRSVHDRQELATTALMPRLSDAVAVLVQERQHNETLAYVYKEPNVPGFELNVTFQRDASGVTLTTLLDEEQVGDDRDAGIDGYVYLACPPTSSTQIIRIRIPYLDKVAMSVIPGKVTLRNGSAYGHTASIFEEYSRDFQHLYYRVLPDPSGIGNWIGIPFRIGISFTFHVDVLQ